ncbi:hypothetical protein [Streptomyces litchfieldiae]|uniref:Uncharacterized protein n=1 Tax=Streptomyces litchfieldiae TaxID=3075543 RepID=A0ABU2MWH2_9ACTN|nr:hypothetical protein [Streptomyces sp. DSM 44938]MDT0345945.1 hypothetical protein [Streptomyces sp. DSM 44938]
MTEWICGFGYPADGWLPLEVDSPDGAERAAQRIAEREGDGNELYAEAVYPELKVIWEGMRARAAGPVAVWVPPVPLNARPLVPASIFAAREETSPEERTVAAVGETFRRPRPDRLGEADITEIELPLGPACRVHQLLLNQPGDDGRQFVIEAIDYFVLPPDYPEGLFQLSVSWSSPAIAPHMTETADRIATTLTARRAEGVGR